MALWYPKTGHRQSAFELVDVEVVVVDFVDKPGNHAGMERGHV